ncbi:MAG: M48 family metallopeptidase [Myxococcales bacterium]|nr:M48 family metallopeptidase [Myxococcales bacterium]
MLTERSEIQFGLTTIPFLVRRSNRRTTVALTVGPTGKLVVTAPPKTSIDKLNGLVRTKARWVVERIKRTSDVPPAHSCREFVSGETVLYLGRQYRLKVVSGGEGDCAALHGRWLHVPVVGPLHGSIRARAVRHALRGWLKSHAERRLPLRLAAICKRFGIDVPLIVVREQRKRWGSCDAKGTLRINWRIIQAAPSLIDYVLVHELVHLRHQNHTRAFWAEVERMMPDYDERRRKLRRIGASLEW